MLESVKRDLTVQYAGTTSLSPNEISYRLGLSNVRNFRRSRIGAVKTPLGTSVSDVGRGAMKSLLEYINLSRRMAKDWWGRRWLCVLRHGIK